ncbi:MAG: nuclear transport factor 2 family protein [Steroidobacteraceae bacterium]
MHYSEFVDECQIRRLIEQWAVFRDSGEYDRLLSLWHADGRMVTTWSQLSALDFVQKSRAGFQSGAMKVTHFLGGSTIDLNGSRAIAQTKMTISQRSLVEGVLCDTVCIGRFYDFFEKRASRWGIVLRQPIYEQDRIDPVDPAATLTLDQSLLETFPEGYRHLAYAQSKMGLTINCQLPGLKGPTVEALYKLGSQWLTGEVNILPDVWA